MCGLGTLGTTPVFDGRLPAFIIGWPYISHSVSDRESDRSWHFLCRSLKQVNADYYDLQVSNHLHFRPELLKSF